jgi:hypothetical protein
MTPLFVPFYALERQAPIFDAPFYGVDSTERIVQVPRRLPTLFAGMPLLCSLGVTTMAGTSAADAAVLPPSNPPNHPLAPIMWQDCTGSASAAACNSASLSAIDAARADEGVGPLYLPSNYNSLSAGEQIMVLFNLERTARGLAPIAALTNTLDQDAAVGAANQTDPPAPSGSSQSASLWVGGWGTALYDDFIWMYDDGPGGADVSCCWGHRDAILASYPGTPADVEMGAAVTSTGSYPSSAAAVVAAGVNQTTVFTWSQETPYLSGVNPGSEGYRLGAADGGVFSYGTSRYFGSTGDVALRAPMVGLAGTADRGGYWEVARDGGVFSFGDAGFHGSAADRPLQAPVVGMAADPATGGYWLVSADGGVFSYDAPFLGSAANRALRAPVVGMASTPDGRGYWLVGRDGGIFTFGDAGFHGSTGALQLDQPIVGMAPTPDSRGYWLAAADGGVFSFGDAGYHGSAGGVAIKAPVVGVAAAPDGQGYWLSGAAGSVYSFGSAAYLGSPATAPLHAPVVGVAG